MKHTLPLIIAFGLLGCVSAPTPAPDTPGYAISPNLDGTPSAHGQSISSGHAHAIAP